MSAVVPSARVAFTSMSCLTSRARSATTSRSAAAVTKRASSSEAPAMLVNDSSETARQAQPVVVILIAVSLILRLTLIGSLILIASSDEGCHGQGTPLKRYSFVAGS